VSVLDYVRELAVERHGSWEGFLQYVAAANPYPDGGADDTVIHDGEEWTREEYDSSVRCWAESFRGDGSRCDGTEYSREQLNLVPPSEESSGGIWTESEVPLCRMHTRIWEDRGEEAVEVSDHAANAYYFSHNEHWLKEQA
jgi:hypothetical protein